MTTEPVTLAELQPFVDPSVDHIIAYGMMGSIIYGLDSDTSDRDIVAVVEGTHRMDRQVIQGDLDCRVMSMESLGERLTKSIPNEVDMVRSDLFKVVYPEYRPYLDAIRFNVYEYIKRNQSQIRSTQIKKDLPETAKQRRRETKSIKAGIRAAMMNRRVAADMSRNFRVRFNDAERAEYFENVLNVVTARADGATKQDVVDMILELQ